MGDLDPVTAAQSTADIFIVRRFKCRNGHEQIEGAVTFQLPDFNSPTVSICASCWRDWMVAQGWEATPINQEL